ncbi:MAG: HD domain-containing protein [Candidatus Methanospirareceae archaeon]
MAKTCVVVSHDLIYSHLKEPRIKAVFNFLERDVELQTYLRMGNIMAVRRLHYNDHGPTHSRIVSGSALEIFKILSKTITPTSIEEGLYSAEDALLVVLCGAYLHDIGNAIHRTAHHIHGYYIAIPIIDRMLAQIYPDDQERWVRLKAGILHCIFAHDEEVRCLTMEAGTVTVADGTDMAEGRARIPYRTGKVDIHSLSALAIRKVELAEGERRPVRIVVQMDNPAGVFQIEEVLERKIASSDLDNWIEVVALERDKELKTITVDAELKGLRG